MSPTKEVCRLCLSNKNLLLPIFQNNFSEGDIPFRTKLSCITSIEVFADDHFPLKVCYICFHQVEKFFQFQAMCHNSELLLQSQIKVDETTPRALPEENTSVIQETDYENKKFDTVTCYNSSNSEDNKQHLEQLHCGICQTIFQSDDLLLEHLIKSHKDLNVLYCKSCKIAFSKLNEYENHLKTQHSFNCNLCDYVFKQEESLKDHLKFHIQETFVCKLCKKMFLSLKNLKKHEILHLKTICNYCNKELSSENALDSHLKECNKKYYCKICNETFSLKKELIEHTNMEHENCDLKTFESSESTTAFNELQEYKSNSEDQNFFCQNCEIEFTDELSLVNHIATNHSADMLTCKFCAKKFGLKSSLKRHERSHSGVKPYQCKYCPRKFKDSSACVVHTRTHTGEHPFRCQECHKDFKQLANLKMHTYRHHKKNNKTDAASENKSDYDALYNRNIMHDYSENNLKNYQDLNESISDSFNQGLHIIMPH